MQMETRMKQAVLSSTSGSSGDVEPLVQPLIVDGTAKLYDQFRKEKVVSYEAKCILQSPFNHIYPKRTENV